jgi:hypothetical protein
MYYKVCNLPNIFSHSISVTLEYIALIFLCAEAFLLLICDLYA